MFEFQQGKLIMILQVWKGVIWTWESSDLIVKGEMVGMACILLDLIWDLCHQWRKAGIMEKLSTVYLAGINFNFMDILATWVSDISAEEWLFWTKMYMENMSQ